MLLPKLRNGYLAPPVIIILALITLAVAATLLFQAKFFSKKDQTSVNQTVTTPSPAAKSSPSPASNETANWKSYAGKYVSFKSPPEWSLGPTNGPLGYVYENLKITIAADKEISEFNISDSAADYNEVSKQALKDLDITKSTNITVDGRSGVALTRKGSNYYSYDILVPGSEQVGSFSIHLTTSSSYQQLEKTTNLINQVAQTIKFLK